MIAILTDSHFGARNDSPVFREYFKKFLHETFFPELKTFNITTVIHAGDLFDRRKFINFETLNFFRQHFFEPLQEMGIQMIVTIGNHDTVHKNSSRVNSVTELCSFYTNITILTEATEMEFEGVKVLLVPWINEGNYERTIQIIQNTEAEYAIGHLELKGFWMQRGLKAESGMDRNIFKKFKRVMSGHYHHISEEDNVNFLGAMAEITFADVNDPRGFNEWDPKTNEFTHIPNPFRMFHRLYYDDRDKPLDHVLKKVNSKFAGTYVKVIVQHRTNPYYYEQFMEKLYSFDPVNVKIEENYELPDDGETQIDVAEDILTILNKYVDTLEIDVDKTKVKEEIGLLHIEAINLER